MFFSCSSAPLSTSWTGVHRWMSARLPFPCTTSEAMTLNYAWDPGRVPYPRDHASRASVTNCLIAEDRYLDALVVSVEGRAFIVAYHFRRAAALGRRVLLGRILLGRRCLLLGRRRLLLGLRD